MKLDTSHGHAVAAAAAVVPLAQRRGEDDGSGDSLGIFGGLVIIGIALAVAFSRLRRK